MIFSITKKEPCIFFLRLGPQTMQPFLQPGSSRCGRPLAFLLLCSCQFLAAITGRPPRARFAPAFSPHASIFTKQFKHVATLKEFSTAHRATLPPAVNPPRTSPGLVSLHSEGKALALSALTLDCPQVLDSPLWLAAVKLLAWLSGPRKASRASGSDGGPQEGALWSRREACRRVWNTCRGKAGTKVPANLVEWNRLG